LPRYKATEARLKIDKLLEQKPVLITGTLKPDRRSREAAKRTVQGCKQKNRVILTGDNDGIEQYVIQLCSSYPRFVVWGAEGNSRFIPIAGHVELADYNSQQRDDVLVTRSSICVFVGQDKRTKKMIELAEKLDKEVRRLK